MKNTKKSSTGKIKGYLVQEGSYIFFKPSKGEKLPNQVGYVKYDNKVDTNVDVGFIDYYPVTDFLLSKLLDENVICELETKEGQIVLHEDKLIIII
jgi:hypothetical protein